MTDRQVTFSKAFIRRTKGLSKKYRRIQDDVNEFADELENGATPGDLLQGTGDFIVYKARIASRDMQRGKSGGFRAAYYLRTDTHVVMLIIYAKGEKDNLSAAEVVYLVKQALEELENEAASDDSPDDEPADPE